MQQQEVSDLYATDKTFDAAWRVVEAATKDGFASGWHHENHHRVDHRSHCQNSDEKEPEPKTEIRDLEVLYKSLSIYLPEEDVNLLVQDVQSQNAHRICNTKNK